MKRMLTSCFGLGFLPIASGTFGSMPVMVIFALMCWGGISTAVIFSVMVISAVAGSFVCVRYGPEIIEMAGNEDPSEIVADEFAGQAVTYIVGGWVVGPIWLVAVGGVLLFRLFDILKPWPCRRLEKLPKGWGVLADDLMAGVYAGIVLQICFRLWIAG